jgi:glycyl-tRNA synthetase beta chain
MVGEFPELQGVMGGHYARQQREDALVADAIAQHYRPLGPSDAVPTEPVAVALALADKLDQLAAFFAVGERPTGSSDPFALRRAALGVIALVRNSQSKLSLLDALVRSLVGDGKNLEGTVIGTIGNWYVRWQEQLYKDGLEPVPNDLHPLKGPWAFPYENFARAVSDFLLDRLRVQLRAEGARHDLVAASIGPEGQQDDDILRILARAAALQSLIESDTGTNLLAAYKRAQNILRIEEKKDGPHAGPVDEALLAQPEEQALNTALAETETTTRECLAREDFPAAMTGLAALRAPTDAFFEGILVNDPDPSLRLNRLRLLSRLRAAMDAVADFSQIEA